jgi:mRNA interferase RelE/StbE
MARLPEKAATAAVEFLQGSLPANPHRAGTPLKLGLDRLHSARRGDYRVIYRIDDQHRRVDVMAIEHRSDIHRPRQFRKPPDRRHRADVLSGARVAGSRLCPVPARVSVAGGLDASR